MPKASSAKLSYDDLLRFPEDGKRHELIEGVHFVTPSPVLRHQQISIRLASRLFAWVEERGLGEVFTAPTDVVLSRFDVVVPDLLFVSRSRAAILAEANLQGAPDLVVEILSSSTRRRDIDLKRKLYERTGVAEYWIVDPRAETVRVLRAEEGGAFTISLDLGGREAVLTSPLLPGVKIPLAQIFRR